MFNVINDSIIEKNVHKISTIPHPLPDLPLEGGGIKQFPSLSGGGTRVGVGFQHSLSSCKISDLVLSYKIS